MHPDLPASCLHLLDSNNDDSTAREHAFGAFEHAFMYHEAAIHAVKSYRRSTSICKDIGMLQRRACHPSRRRGTPSPRSINAFRCSWRRAGAGGGGHKSGSSHVARDAMPPRRVSNTCSRWHESDTRVAVPELSGATTSTSMLGVRITNHCSAEKLPTECVAVVDSESYLWRQWWQVGRSGGRGGRIDRMAGIPDGPFRVPVVAHARHHDPPTPSRHQDAPAKSRHQDAAAQSRRRQG